MDLAAYLRANSGSECLLIYATGPKTDRLCPLTPSPSMSQKIGRLLQTLLSASQSKSLRALSLVTAVVVSALAGALVTKLHTSWTSACGGVPCSYVQIRLEVVNQMIAARSGASTYLVIGDSLTEIAPWPTICGRGPVAAGIGGARSDTWLPHAKAVADRLKPDFVVLALGTNDVLTQGRLGPYEQLAASLADHRVIAVPVHFMPRAPDHAVREANNRIAKAVQRTTEGISAKTIDGVHLTAEDYARWLGAIEKAAC